MHKAGNATGQSNAAQERKRVRGRKDYCPLFSLLLLPGLVGYSDLLQATLPRYVLLLVPPLIH